jgi:hypothetical protein
MRNMPRAISIRKQPAGSRYDGTSAKRSSQKAGQARKEKVYFLNALYRSVKASSDFEGLAPVSSENAT